MGISPRLHSTFLRPLRLVLPIFRLQEHILRQNAVALGGIIYQNMGHCAHQLAVLQNGAAAHALDNPAGGFQQAGVGHLEHQVPGIRAVGGIFLIK